MNTTQPAWNVNGIDCGFKALGQAALAAIAVSVPLLAVSALIISNNQQEVSQRAQIASVRYASHERLVSAPAGPMLNADAALHGRELFTGSCAACHKADGTGLEGLGKDLTKSWFVAALNDDELLAFVKAGRPATSPDNDTKVAMPPKGGHDEFTDADLSSILTYVRGLQDPRRMPNLPNLADAPVTDADKAKALAAAGGDAELAEFIAHGTKVFAGTCSACHGKDAHGLQGLGKDLVNSQFCKSLDDDGLLAFVKRGRDPNDPANTTKVAMPPKGGNPALSDDDLLDVIAYVRSLQKQASAAK